VITREGKESEVKWCEVYIWKLFLSKFCVTVFSSVDVLVCSVY
jgi:hypothetical protein